MSIFSHASSMQFRYQQFFSVQHEDVDLFESALKLIDPSLVIRRPEPITEWSGGELLSVTAVLTADLEAKPNAAMAAHGISFRVNTSGTNPGRPLLSRVFSGGKPKHV
mgnify:CR=1 FL=1